MSRSVLVVDDEESVRALFEHLLLEIGCRVVQTGTAGEALAAVEQTHFDLAVLDKNLPDRSGLDLLAELKGRDPDLEVMMVTGYASLEAAVTALRFGAGDFLTKPFEDIDVVSEKLRMALERARRARERTAFVARFKDREKELEHEVARRTRELERAMLRLEGRDGERRRLMADVAHDLRTPLTTIRGYVDMLEAHPGTDGQAQGWLSVVGGQCRRLERLTQDVTFLARHDEGRVRWNLDDLEVAVLFADAADEMRPLFDREGIGLSVQVLPGAELLCGDRDRLMQVLTNLLGNALKFAPEGSAVRLCAEPDEEAVVLLVADEGPGVPPELRERVFERWHSGDPAGRGEGIGLSICRDIAEGHGGRIWVGDDEGGGAVFRVVIPTAKSSRGAA